MKASKLDRALNWARKSSLWAMPVGLGHCGVELTAMAAGNSGLARLGIEFCHSPRQADLMIVAGRVSWKMAPVIRTLYDQMPEPKWVMALGTSGANDGAASGYATQSVDRIIPVDVHVPGSPPSLEQFLHGIALLREKIQNERGSFRRTLNLS